MAVEQNLALSQFQERYWERNLVQNDKIVNTAHVPANPEGAQKHAYVGTQSVKAPKQLPGKTVSPNFDVEVFAFGKAPVRVIMGRIYLNLIIITF